MARTPRLELPLIEPGQAQKEVLHNEALQRLDALVGGCVEEAETVRPPAAPLIGKCFLVAKGAAGAWADRDGCLAAWTEGGWHFVDPSEGMQLAINGQAETLRYIQKRWVIGQLAGQRVMINGVQVVGGQGAAIGDPGGGKVVDDQARAAIVAILGAMREHGLIKS